MSKQKVIVLRGLIASGKSTYAKQLVDTLGWKRVNKDDLRAMIDNGKWSDKNEKEILKTRDSLISRWLIEGYSVVVDDTNFAHKHIDSVKETVDLVNALKDKNIEFEILDFNTPLYECIERDSKREKPVGKKTIIKMYNQYLYKAPVDIIDEKLPTCVICDIDGSLSYMCERGIFEYKKVEQDLPNKNLITLLSFIPKEIPIFIFSGREDNCRAETENWLRNNNVRYDKLVMRKSGDNRKDAIVKTEIFKEHIEDKYNVLTVFDDRPSVCRNWKYLGLFVCDVNRQDSRIDF